MIAIWLLAIWLLGASFFTIGALLETRKLLVRIRATADPEHWPAVAILRPCAGLEPGLEENLESTVGARYGGRREVFLLVASEDDPAFAIVERVRARARAVRVVVTGTASLYNRKVAQLAAAEGLSSAPVVCVIDSDVVLDDDTLPCLVRALVSDARAGAASCPPVDVLPSTLGDHASSALLSSTPHAFYCLAALAERSHGAHVLCGALIAIHRHVLEELGGFATLETYLGEDFELARRLHARGYTIPTAAAPARITDTGRTLRHVASRFRRWATVTRRQRPHLMVSYPFLLASTPLLVPLSLAVHAPALWLGLVGYLALRTMLAMTLRRAYGLGADPLRSFGAMLLGETLALVTAMAALGRPVVTWRGHRYAVARDGLLRRVEPERS